jgi:hypothetical protein
MKDSLKTAEVSRNAALEARRAFLAKAARVALAAPLTTSLILVADSKPALATSPYGRPGYKHSRNGPKHKVKRVQVPRGGKGPVGPH